MIYEWRAYHVRPRQMETLHSHFRDFLLRLFEKHGIKVIGFWEAEIGVQSTLYYMLAFEDLAHRERAWSSYRRDPERAALRAKWAKEEPTVSMIKNMILRPTDYSPMK